MKKLVMAIGLLAWAGGTFADAAEMLENANFEAAVEKGHGWSLGGKFAIGPHDGHNGSGGLTWQSAAPCGKLQAARQTLKGVKPGDMLVYSMLVKKDGFRRNSNQGAVFSIEMRDENDKWICALYGTMARNQPDGEWAVVESSGIVPARMKTAVVVIYVSGDCSGKVTWDNIHVEKYAPKPVAFVCSSAYRDEVAGNQDVRFAASLNVAKEQQATAHGTFCYRTAEGSGVCVPAKIVNGKEATLALKGSELAMGEQRVEFHLEDGAGKELGAAGVMIRHVAERTKRRVYLDGKGRCVVDGKLFFPMGMYWNPSPGRMSVYKQGGFNCCLHYEMLTRQRLDFCAENGLMTFSCPDRKLWKRADVEVETAESKAARERLKEAILKTKDHPALLAWYIGDEAPTGAVPGLKRFYEFVRVLDPDHPVYVVQDRIYDLRPFTETADVLGLDPYPVDNHPLGRVTQFMRDGRAATLNARVMWSVPQAFSWQWYRPEAQETERFPSAAEMRSMIWQHIAGGANGILSFAFGSMYYPLNKDDWRPRWALTAQVHREVARLMPVLLADAPAFELTPGTSDIALRAWLKDGELYLLVCSLKAKPMDATVRIGSGVWKMDGTELGSAAALSDDGTTASFYLDAWGVSLVRLGPVRQIAR